jgi:hypothetical protein
MKERNMRHEKKQKQNKGKEKEKKINYQTKRNRKEKKKKKIRLHFTCESNPLPLLPLPSLPHRVTHCNTSHLPVSSSNLQNHSRYTPACLPNSSTSKIHRSLYAPFRSMKHCPEGAHIVHV